MTSSKSLQPKQFFYILLLVGVGVLALGVLGYHTLISQLQSRVDASHEAEIRNEVSSLELELAQTNIAKYQDLKDWSDQINQLLPDEKQQSEAVTILVNIFNELGLNANSISFDNPDTGPSSTSQTIASGISGVVSLPVTISFAEPIPYTQAIALIQELETSGRHISLVDVRLSGAEGDTVNLNLRLTLQLLDNGGGA